MKTCLYALLLICTASACLGADVWVDILFYKQNIFSISECEYLKSLLPQYRGLLNNMIIARKQGKSFAYEFEIEAELWGGKATSATLYKPDGTFIPLKWDAGDNEFYFETDDPDTLQEYFTFADFYADFPDGQYHLDVTFAKSGTETYTFTIPAYNESNFPDLPEVNLKQDSSGQLILEWKTVANSDNRYNVWADNLKGFQEVCDEDFYIAHSHTEMTALGAYKSKGDYELGVTAYAAGGCGTNFCIEFNSDTHLFSFKKAFAVVTNNITKSTVSMGKGMGMGNISFSGTLDAIEADFLMAMGDIVEVFIDSDLMPGDISFQFPIDDSTFKKGKYAYSESSKGSSYAFSYDTKTGKMAFAAKTINLAGMACPIVITVKIGDYEAQVLLDEAVVNGKKPCPAQLMMGVQNSLTVTKSKVKYGKAPLSDTFTAQGTFTIDGDYDMYKDLVVTLGSQSLHVEGDKFDVKNDIVSCKGAQSIEGLIVDAKFDFIKCTYSITVKNASIAQSGDVPFGIDCFGVGLYGFASITIN